MKTKKVLSIVFAIFLLVVLLHISLGIITGLNIDGGLTQVTSDQQLTCYWSLDQTTSANVTWYVNGTANITQNSIACAQNVQCSTSGNGNVPSSYTMRGENWTCSVSYYNGSSIESGNISVIIINSPPTPPKIYYSNGSDTTNSTAQILEGNTTTFIVNSTDADNDPITYTINDTAFCTIGTSSGMLTCTPNTSSERGIRNIKIGAEDYASAQYSILTLNVTPINYPPQFSPALQNQTVHEGNALNYSLNVYDDENDFPYNFTIISNLTSLVIVSTGNTTAMIEFNNSGKDIASYADRGNYTVYVNVADSGEPALNLSSANATYSFNIEVIPTNQLPNISYVVFNNNSLIQGGNLSIYVNATDLDGDALSFYTNSSLYNITYTSPTTYNSTNASFAYALINVTNMSNDYVVFHSFTLYAFDTKQNSTAQIDLNVTNINDPPIIYDISTDTSNTLNNTNISSLIAYTGVQLRYKVNASDPDDLTYDAANTGLGTYSTNDSMFAINSTTGMLEFTPNQTGNYTFIVTVTDRGGLLYNKTASIEIMLNHNPQFTQNPIIISCSEYDSINWPYDCYYNISANVTDIDIGDYVADFWTNSSFFTINDTTGIINFTPNQSIVGNYSILLNITDTRGGMNSTNISIILNNTNNPPDIGNPILSGGNIVVGHVYSISFNASDLDLLLPNTYENLTFSMNITKSNISISNSSIFSLSKISDTQAIIIINPTSTSDSGNYTLNVTVTDFYGNVSYYFFPSLLIYNQTQLPQIVQIIPSGTPYNSTIDNTTWMNASLFPGNTTTIYIYENQSYTFNQTSVYDPIYPNYLNYSWYYDGTLVSTMPYFNKYFDFFSSGEHNLTLVINDQYYSNNSFSWDINVTDVDRQVIYYNNSLENLTVPGSISIADYMTYRNGQARFYDPDDDPANKGYSLGNETSLNFSASFCSYANFSFSNATLLITAKAVGFCYVIFTATDVLNSSNFVSSQPVYINVTNISQSAQQVVQQQVSSLSSGGGSNSQPIPVPLPQEVEKPVPLHIIVPNLVTVYQNQTITVPIIINNTWNDSLNGISLYAHVNVSNVSISLDKNYISKLDVGQSAQLTLTVSNYKSSGHYEIEIGANVTNPQYIDTATIFVNSADMYSEGDALASKISFARDLLSSNPECMELNEILNQAKQELAKNDYVSTAKLVDDVINGCKYLVNNVKVNNEQPSNNFVSLFNWQSYYNQYIILGIFTILLFISLYYIFKKESPEQEF